jgi:hypothetical protein
MGAKREVAGVDVRVRAGGRKCRVSAAPRRPKAPRARKTKRQPMEDGAGDVGGHDAGDEESRPLFGDVGDGDDEDAGGDEALEKAPEREGMEAGGGGGEQRAEGEREHGEQDGALAIELFAEEGEQRGGDGHAEGGGADGEADVGFGGVEDLREERQQRLHAVEIEEGEGAAEEDGEQVGGLEVFARLDAVERRRACGSGHRCWMCVERAAKVGFAGRWRLSCVMGL